MKKIVLKAVFLFFILVSFKVSLYAQTDPGDPDEDEPVPLDPGSWVLAAVGVGYGVKKWRDAKRKDEKDAAAATAFFLEDDIKKK